ncbi:MAG: hypothetical protein R3Y08_04470 [Rikenellaceae bacterium]
MKKLMLMAAAAIFVIGSAVAQPQRPQGREKISTEERVEQLQEQLGLSDKQCEQLTTMMEEREKAAKEGGQQERGNREAMQEMMEAEKKEMKKILTDEQYEKWEEMISKRQQRPQEGGNRPSRQ